MHNRRAVLRYSGAVAVALAAPEALLLDAPLAGAAPQQQQRLHLVNGWILTDADLVRLELDDR